MTNKVKPFYIKITDDMTPQMVQDAFDKCVDAGAYAGDRPLNAEPKHTYESSYSYNYFNYIGVTDSCAMNSTRFYMNDHDYSDAAQEITLDQLDEWLGLEIEQGWKIGDKAAWHQREVLVIGYHPEHPVIVIDTNNGIWAVGIGELSKLETPEQKAEREKKEAIDEIKGTIDFFSDSYMSALSLYEQGYRKQ